MSRDQTGGPPPQGAGGAHPDVDLKAFADGELSALRRILVRRHVARCARCQQEIDVMKKLSATFAADNALNGSSPLAPDLRARLLERMQGAVPSPRTAPSWRRSPVFVFGSSALAAVAMFTIFFPVYARLRANARQASMASNGKQFGIGLLSYLQDYDEKFPPLATLGEGANGFVVVNKAPAAPGVTSPLMSSFTENAEWASGRSRVALEQYAIEPLFSNENDARQVHKKGSIGVVIPSGKLEATSNRIEEIVRTAGGFVASNNLQTNASDGYRSADLTIKAPVQVFEDVMKRLAKMGEVVAQSVNDEDLTEKISDAVQAEQTLAGEARETEARLKREWLSNRHATQKEAELRQVKIQLAQTRAQLHLLRKWGALATITVSLTERPRTVAVAPPISDFLADVE